MSTNDATAPAGDDPAIKLAAAADAPAAEDKKDKPRDSKGWDGKLRIQKDGPADLDDDPEDGESGLDSEEEEAGEARARVVQGEAVEGEVLDADEDLLDDTPEDEDQIDLVHMRISDITALRLERFRQLKVCSSPYCV